MKRHIHRGSGAKLRNVKWIVTDERVSRPLLERSVIYKLRLNAYEMPETTTKCFSTAVYENCLLEAIKQYGVSRVSRVIENVSNADGREKRMR